MNLWNKIVVVAKFLLGGFESVTDYLLSLLNEFIGQEGIAERVKQVRDYASVIFFYMKKYEKYCPAIWAGDFVKLLATIQVLLDVFEDGKVTPEEANSTVSAVQEAIAEWMK